MKVYGAFVKGGFIVFLLLIFLGVQADVFALDRVSPFKSGVNQDRADPGEQSPDFTVPVYYNGGPPADTFTLYDYWGWVILINFWTIW